MNKFTVPAISCVLALALAGCSATKPSEDDTETINPKYEFSVEQVEDTTPISAEIDEPPEDEQPEEVTAPSKEEVYAAREEALSGMSTEQIERLKQVIKSANMWWEYGYLYDNIFKELEDPNSLTWNYFEQTGEIQIGWAYSGDLDKDSICTQEGISEDEFYEKYGTGVVTNNKYDAESFISLIDELKSTVESEKLIGDLQRIIDEVSAAKDNHDVENANNLYKILHDLDYFLLRYGLEDVGPYVRDISTISKYYGTLSFYD